VAYLVEENRILRGHVRGRLRLTDEERRRLARHGHRLGRRRLGEIRSAAFADVRGWAAYSTITNAPRERGGGVIASGSAER